jgi:hypothetical protein
MAWSYLSCTPCVVCALDGSPFHAMDLLVCGGHCCASGRQCWSFKTFSLLILVAHSIPPPRRAPTMSSHGRKTVLFMTVAEAGQSNSILALALELLTHPNVDVHVASFPVLRKRAEELSSSARVVERKHPGSTFTFQEIDGMAIKRPLS